MSVQALHSCGGPERYTADAARGGDLCMKLTSTTDLEFPRLPYAIRQGEGKDVPADPEAAALIVTSASLREGPEPERATTRQAL